jgi:hypothetical protein
MSSVGIKRPAVSLPLYLAAEENPPPAELSFPQAMEVPLRN